MKTKILTGLFLVVGLTGLLLLTACNNDDDPPIQTGYVNITIYPNSTEYISLNSPGGYAYINANEPSRGILVYRLTLEDFKAFERTPTYKPDSCCILDPVRICSKVIVDESSLFVVDTCSGSKWLIIDGTVQNGPATYPLVPYQTFYDGFSLRIYN
ncbi:MAG: hypothetical protein IH598_14745 [Bacteroidales bacterium]|nr:hypothetical protein [Bacteroidales bacterium]